MSDSAAKKPGAVIHRGAVGRFGKAVSARAKEQPRLDKRGLERGWADETQWKDGPPGMGPPVAATTEPGGAVLTEALQHPSFGTLDRLWRKLPEERMFDSRINPKEPIKFAVGTFEVPKNQHLWLTDYAFRMLRLSGLDPGDFVYAAEGRFSGQIAFDLTASGKRENNLRYEIDPQPIPRASSNFRSQDVPGPIRRAGRADFDESAASSFGSTAGVGTSALPVGERRQGPRDGPFTIIVKEGQTVSLEAVLFRPLTATIAAIEGRIAGFLLHSTQSQALVNRLQPR